MTRMGGAGGQKQTVVIADPDLPIHCTDGAPMTIKGILLFKKSPTLRREEVGLYRLVGDSLQFAL